MGLNSDYSNIFEAKLIIFDFDGVIIDSMNVKTNEYKLLFSQFTKEETILNEKFKIESQKSLRLEQEINNISKIRLEQDLELSKAILEKNTISFAGLKLKKNTFKIIIWSIFLTLIILTCFFAYKLKDGIKITSQAKNELIKVEEEFNSYKKKSLVRDQKLRRQLQDEINKQRGV
mgnify:CR=1 FL=1